MSIAHYPVHPSYYPPDADIQAFLRVTAWISDATETPAPAKALVGCICAGHSTHYNTCVYAPTEPTCPRGCQPQTAWGTTRLFALERVCPDCGYISSRRLVYVGSGGENLSPDPEADGEADLRAIVEEYLEAARVCESYTDRFIRLSKKFKFTKREEPKE